MGVVLSTNGTVNILVSPLAVVTNAESSTPKWT